MKAQPCSRPDQCTVSSTNPEKRTNCVYPTRSAQINRKKLTLLQNAFNEHFAEYVKARATKSKQNSRCLQNVCRSSGAGYICFTWSHHVSVLLRREATARTDMPGIVLSRARHTCRKEPHLVEELAQLHESCQRLLSRQPCRLRLRCAWGAPRERRQQRI